MLSNQHRYSFNRLGNVLKAVLFSFLSFFVKRKNCIVLTASRNRLYSDSTRALFEYLMSRGDLNYEVYFVLQDADRRQALNRLYPGRFLDNTKLEDLLVIFSARIWVMSALESPAPGFFQRHLRTVYHVGHGMPYKVAGLCEKRVPFYKKWYYKLVTTNITYTWSTSRVFRDTIAAIYGLEKQRVLIAPQPKTGLIGVRGVRKADCALFEEDYTHILYAPTWRHSSSVSIFPFDDLDLQALDLFFRENRVVCWLRFHPAYEQDAEAICSNMENVRMFRSSQYEEVNQYLAFFAALITDYSSLYYEFLTLERPVLFFDYDVRQFKKEIGLIDGYEKIKVAESTYTMQQFIEQLQSILQGEMDLEEVRRVNRLVNYPIRNQDILPYVVDSVFGLGRESPLST